VPRPQGGLHGLHRCFSGNMKAVMEAEAFEEIRRGVQLFSRSSSLRDP
jgi:hypothetical protein